MHTHAARIQMKIADKNKVTIYEPNHILKLGLRVWPEMVGELIQYRGLIWRLILRDISARYKQSIMGIFWSFLTPLIMTLLFVWVKDRKILQITDTDMPYAAFVFYGQMIWLIFAQGLTLAAQSLTAVGPMLRKINFPKEILVISAIGQTIFEFLLRLPLLAALFIWTGFHPTPAIIFLPLIIAPLVLLCTGLGFLAALSNSFLRDIGNLLAIIINLGMFATPIIYPPPTTWPMSFLVNYLNPVSGFVNAARDLALTGRISDPASLSSATILAFLLFFFGWRLFHIMEPKIAERI